MFYKNHYLTLAIPPWVTQAEIKSAYKIRLKLCHPDVLRKDVELAKSITQRINEAYDVLVDVDSRKSYDDEILFQLDTEEIPNPIAVLNFQMGKEKEFIEEKLGSLGACQAMWHTLYEKIRENYLDENLLISAEEKLKAVHDIDLAYNWQIADKGQSFDKIRIRSLNEYECEWRQFLLSFPIIRLSNRDLITSIIGYGLLLETQVIEGSVFRWGFKLASNKFQDPLIQVKFETHASVNFSRWQMEGSDFWSVPFTNTEIRIYSSHVEKLKFLAGSCGHNTEIEGMEISVSFILIKGEIRPIVDFLHQVFLVFGIEEGDVIYIGYD